MIERPSVSIIVPAYNGEAFLPHCLDSIFSQTLKKLQVICVNDGSTDGTAAILVEYQKNHPDMIVISQENSGLSAARNAGLTYATGEYVDFLDCDDWLQKDALEILYTHASNNSLDMLFYDGETVYENEELRNKYPGYDTLYKTKIQVKKTYTTGEKLFVRLVKGRSYRASACMYLLRLDFLKKQSYSFLPGVYYEDNVFTLQCLLSAKRAGVHPTPFYKRSLRDSSIVTEKKNFHHAYSSYICQNALQQFISSRKLSAAAVRCAQQQISSLMNQTIRIYSKLAPEERSEALRKYPEAQQIDALSLWNEICNASATQNKKEKSVSLPMWMNSSLLKPYISHTYCSETPFISVILPVYNAAKYLHETVKDLQNQRLTNFEMIFVDDGSTDDSCKILEEYAKNDCRIQIIKQKNLYAGIARNTGMARARGEYLLFLDSDDRFDPNMLLYAYACAKSNDAQVVLFHADLLQMPQKTYAPAAFLCPCKRLPTAVFSGHEGRNHIFDVLNPWTKLFKRQYIQQLGIKFQPFFSSNDLYFIMVAMACAERIAPLPIVLVHYRVGLTTNIQSKKSKAPLDVFHAFAAVKEELRRKQMFADFRKPFAVKAAESMLRSLDTMTTMEGYQQLYQLLHDGGFEQLEISCITPEDMRHISNGQDKLQRCKAIMETEFNAYLLQSVTQQISSNINDRRNPTNEAQVITDLQNELLALRNSYAYRIGSKLMIIPHLGKEIIKKILYKIKRFTS